MFQRHWLKQRNTATLQHIWLNLCAVYCKTFSAWYVSTHGGWDIARGVVVNFDWRERFPRPRSQQRGACAPRTARSRAGGECGRGSPPPIFLRLLIPNGPENKLIESQPNEYDVICRTLQCERSTCGQRYLPEHRSGSKIFAGTAFHCIPTPLHSWILPVIKSAPPLEEDEHGQKAHVWLDIRLEIKITMLSSTTEQRQSRSIKAAQWRN